MIIFRRYLALIGIAFGTSTSVMANELPDKFAIKLGAFIANSMDTDISVNPFGGIIGTNINFSRDLGGEDDKQVPRLTGYYRFNEAHRIDYGYYKIDRDGITTLGVDIRVGDVVFPLSSTVITELNAAVYKVGYTYSFYHNEKVELGISAGLHVKEYSYSLVTDDGTLQKRSSFTAPLPIFGFLMNYNITPAWSTFVKSELFFVEIGDRYKGSLVDLSFGTEYRLFENVGLGVSISRLGLNAEIDEPNYRGSISDVYKGFTVYAGVYF